MCRDLGFKVKGSKGVLGCEPPRFINNEGEPNAQNRSLFIHIPHMDPLKPKP